MNNKSNLKITAMKKYAVIEVALDCYDLDMSSAVAVFDTFEEARAEVARRVADLPRRIKEGDEDRVLPEDDMYTVFCPENEVAYEEHNFMFNEDFSMKYAYWAKPVEM